MRLRRQPYVVLLLVLGLVVAACGTRLDDEQLAYYDSLGSGGSGSTTRSAATSSGDGSSASGAETFDPADPVDSGGSAVVVDGPDEAASADPGAGGGDGPAVVAGATPCSAPSSEVGVTDDTITIGNVSQLSGVLPGFAQPAVDGAQAYLAYLNAHGGLCGRAVELVVADDGFDAARNAAEVKRLSESVLAFGSGFSVSDSGYASVLAGTNIVDSGVATTIERKESENNYNGIAHKSAGPEFRYAAEQGVKKAIIVHVAAAAGRTQAEAQQERMNEVGIETELLEVSNTQFSFAGTARNVMDSGAQLMLMIYSLPGAVQMAKEMRELGPPLEFEIYTGIYGPSFIEQAGPDAEAAHSILQFLPFTDAATNEELASYLNWLNRVAPNEPPGFYSVMAWVQMKMLTDAIAQIDGPITRDALQASIRSFTDYDAGGVIPPVNVVTKAGPGCKVVVTVKNGEWVRRAPDSGFLC